jgi:putative addiction module component (TIGR02574 family)
MSREQLAREIMALPIAEKVSLAQMLWQNIDDELLSSQDDGQVIREAQRRDAELSSGQVVGRTHEQVIEAMRRAIKCA